jgi:hypothetical protein
MFSGTGPLANFGNYPAGEKPGLGKVLTANAWFRQLKA